MTEVRAVLFDLDETLFDQQHASASGLAAVAERHVVLQALSLPDLELEYFRLLNTGHADVLAGRVSQTDARALRFRRLVERCGGAITFDQATALASLYSGSYREARRPMAGAIDLLRHLQGRVSIGVLSNNFTAQQQEVLHCCGMTDLIDFLVTSEDVGHPKPHRAIFDAALTRVGCTPEQAVMVGDSWESDVLGASQVGIRPIWFNRRRAPQPTLDAGVLYSFEPLEDTVTMLLGD